jgi:carboxylesterase
MPYQPDYDVPTARRAYTLPAGPVGVLMLHGFLGSPISSRPLAESLAARGITVHCPLLPGHGELPNKLYRVPRQAWIAEAEEALAYLSERCAEIFLMGHSMGTVLNAHLVQRHGRVRGMIMMAPVYEVPSRSIHLLRVLRYVMPWFYPLSRPGLQPLVEERLHDFDPGLKLDDPAIQAALPEMSRVPTSAIDEMRKVIDLGRRLWPRLDVPAIIFQGGRDPAAAPGNTRRIYELLPHADKALHIFELAGHELMRPFEPVHAEVWSRVYDFIRGRSALLEETTAAAAGLA